MPKIKDVQRKPKHCTTIGGQALIEGVMMKGPKDIAIAVRKPDNQIELKKEAIKTPSTKYKFLKWPFVRGVVGLIEAMVIGVESLMYSAQFYEEEEATEPGKIDKFFDKVFKDKAENVAMYISVFISMLIAIVVFMLGPTFITNLIKRNIESPIILNSIEGLIRILMFLAYVVAISKMKDIQRVFEYHGAEHKTIHCYEHEEELTVENVKKYPILHPRCGTSFLFMVMIISILVFAFFGWPNPLKRFLIRIAMLPVIAGISYEINRIIGRSNSKLAYWLSYPGLLIQKIATTREPDGPQIEVAIEALKGVLVDDKEADRW
ncbi:DUF1385 domain-containing protein [Proteiniborus sp. MB09-C3]|uniref:DUF1385 domain-containing protein n=1 Tax=Proteiniborus sp. MB09-C3 TaxID=3050072 RepID=UPI0025545872|nr:DUF1385 domain-containing protein [Proteiniborus sp. MB09-C3]WIV12211.1 DUF1385 domain-containing protein [Proteiniborus sp. MB09-C3]